MARNCARVLRLKYDIVGIHAKSGHADRSLAELTFASCPNASKASWVQFLGCLSPPSLYKQHIPLLLAVGNIKNSNVNILH